MAAKGATVEALESLYRAGFFTHYAGEGAVKSCKIGHGSEQVDLCTCRTLASFSEEGNTRIVTLDPVTIEFEDLSVQVQTVFRLTEGTGEVEIVRRILDSTDPEAELSVDEYITACYGTTEYPEDMTGIRLTLTNTDKIESIDYAYQCRESELENVHCVEALIPQVDSRLSIRTDASSDASAIGYFREGFSFSPMYTLGIRKTIKAKGELRTWLKVAKAS